VVERRRVTTGQALAALGLVLLGLVVGWLTAGDGGDSSDGKGAANAGPTDTVEGVPVGYERSREGAVAAVVNYGAALGGPEFITNRARRQAMLRVAATEEVAQEYEKGAAGLAELADTPLYRAIRRGESAIYQGVPLGYRVERYNEDEAEVFTWSASVLGAGQEKPQVLFSQRRTTLRWDGDWKLAGGSEQDGPTPALAEGASASSGAEFSTRLRGLQGLRYVP